MNLNFGVLLSTSSSSSSSSSLSSTLIGTGALDIKCSVYQVNDLRKKHLSLDISCTKQCWFLHHRDMHFNPKTFMVAMQILRNGAKGTNHYRNYFSQHLRYSSNFYSQFWVVIFLNFFIIIIIIIINNTNLLFVFHFIPNLNKKLVYSFPRQEWREEVL